MAPCVGVRSRTRWVAAGVLAAAAVLAVVLASPALAHTQLAQSTPADDTVATRPIEALTLTFTRPVEPLPNGIVVTAADGSPVTMGDQRRSDDGTTITAPLRPPLRTGEYHVAWTILAEDGHPREGTWEFRVAGPAPEPSTAATSRSDSLPPASSPPTARATDSAGASADRPGTGTTSSPATSTGSVTPSAPTGTGMLAVVDDAARIAFYLAALVAVGLTLFKAGPHRGESYGAARLAGWTAAAATTALVASVLEVTAHVGVVSRQGIAGVLDPGTWWAVVNTGLGVAVLLRTLGLGLLGAAVTRRRRRGLPSGSDVGTLAGAGLVIVSFQFVGHTASVSPAWAVRSADLVHAVAAAVWVGGVVGLLVSGRHDVAGRARVTAARFAEVATYAVAGVGVAGLALAWLNLADPTALLVTDYGRILLAKVALVGALALLGAFNHYRIVPALRRGDAGAAASLHRTVGVEATLMLLVLVLTAVLVNLSPR